jgi:hypothetical protein
MKKKEKEVGGGPQRWLALPLGGSQPPPRAGVPPPRGGVVEGGRVF